MKEFKEIKIWNFEILPLHGKVMFLQLLLILFLCFFNCRPIAAATNIFDNINNNFAVDTIAKDTLLKKPRTRVFIASPTVTYAPETRLAGGVFALYYFRMSRKQSDTRASTVDLSIKYTQNKQLIIEPHWKIFSKRDKYVLTGEGIYQDFREFFYGIGNDASMDDEELYSFKMWRFDNRLQRRALERFFIGPRYHFQKMYQVEPESGGLLDVEQITGADGSIVSGLGLASTLDYRNSILTPTEGYYFDFSNVYYLQAFGSDYSFNEYAFDARKYFKIFPKHIFAVQGIFRYLSGDPPFRMLGMLGGPQIMRGHYMGRYRDRNLISAQVEYRLPLFWRFGMAGFASAGEVAHALKDFNLTSLHYGYGLGLRFLLNKKENINARLDVGFGGDSPAIYATVGEAF